MSTPEDDRSVVRLSKIKPPAPVVLSSTSEDRAQVVESVVQPTYATDSGEAGETAIGDQEQVVPIPVLASISSMSSRPRRKLRKWVWLTILLVILGSAGLSAYRYYSFYAKEVAASKLTPTQSLLQAIGTSVTVPTDEEPIIATVTDPALLAGGTTAAFFADAQAGDKVVEYQRHGLAILYRPSTKRIVKVFDRNLVADILNKNVGTANATATPNNTNEFGTVTTTPPVRH